MSTWLISTNGLLLTAGNGLPSVGATPPPAATGSVGITVSQRSTEQVAPEGITVEVNLASLSGFTAAAPTGGVVRDERYHKIEYFWDFYYVGTDNSYTYTAPVNIYDGSAAWTGGYANSRYALGFQASHVYREPGTYTIRLTAYEPQSGVIAYATQEVTIGNPNTLFSGANTIVMSPSNDSTLFAAYPSCTQSTSSDLSTVFEAEVDNTTETVPKRIILERGQTYTGFSLNANACPTVHIVAAPVGVGAEPGGSTKPTFNSVSGTCFTWSDTSDGAGGKDVVIKDIILNGTFDSSATTTVSGPYFHSCASVTGAPTEVLFDGLEWYDFVSVAEDPRGIYIHWNDCVAEGYSYGAALFRATQFAFTGTRIMSRTDALRDATDNQGWGLRFGPATGFSGHTVIHSCDMYSTQDWFNENGQQCLRFGTDAIGGNKINIHGSSFESRYAAIYGGPSLGSPNNIAAPANTVMRSNYFMTAYRSNSLIWWNNGGLTFAQNVWVHGQIADETARNTGAPVIINAQAQDTPSGDSNYDNGIEIYQNTYVNLMNDTYSGDNTLNLTSGAISEYTTNSFFTHENYIIHEPLLSVPNDDEAPLSDAANTYFVSRDAGYRDSGTDLTATTATVKTAGFYDIYAPETTSIAIGAATTGLVGWRDFRGVIRADIATTRSRSQSIGAIESDLVS